MPTSCNSIADEIAALRADIAALDGRFALKSDLNNYIPKSDRNAIISEAVGKAYTQIYNAILAYIEGLFNPSDDLARRVSQLENQVGIILSQLTGVKDTANQALNLAKQAFSKPGIKGDKGDRGERGLQGIPGINGLRGDRGLRGERGLKGDKGDRGLRGERGLKGDMGLRGLPGLTGERGIEGIPGKPGMDGQRGIQGQRGERGYEGLPGRPGLKGERGERGERGLDAREDATLKRRLTAIENYINQLDAAGSKIVAAINRNNESLRGVKNFALGFLRIFNIF
ncbi:collagen-like protein [Anabaena sp. PCC 7938]|uniref:collagen-like protein n=1 Tax=Anabaena sp. PCC 7938 TaxID=1296340 RepID=UPI002033663B|nr:collagen-like protein [Anabaena sp. CCAP 1446/1C]MCM2409398.1 collagen-like protein [Anabaena sp. CCAP 1446/1C]